MKRFAQYIQEREEYEDDTKGLGNIGLDNTSNSESLFRIMRIAIDNHYKDVIDFLESLGEKDSHIKSELQRHMEEKKRAAFGQVGMNNNLEREKDQVVPNGPDTMGDSV